MIPRTNLPGFFEKVLFTHDLLPVICRVLGNSFVYPPYSQDRAAFPLLSLGQYFFIFFNVIVKNVTIVCHSCCIDNCNSNSCHCSVRELDNAVCFFTFSVSMTLTRLVNWQNMNRGLSKML